MPTKTQIPFVRDFNFKHGELQQVAPGLRRVIAPNMGPFTFTGSGTYVVGEGEVAVIDPGPRDPAHIDALLNGLKGEKITHILITHTHSDHSPGAALLKKKCRAKTYGFGPHGGGRKNFVASEEGPDWDFKPDVAVKHGQIIKGKGWSFEAVHTPGHCSNHMCFAWREAKALFTGDHVMGWSTSIVSPPDGDMTDYMNSLRLLLDRDDKIYYPTHGTAITAPKKFVRSFIKHREEREADILKLLNQDARYIPAIVKISYADVDESLYPAAERSVLAHLLHLIEQGKVVANTNTPDRHTLFTAVSNAAE